MCVECGTVLSVSNSPVALQERQFIRDQIAAGKTKDEIKAALVDEYGEEVLRTRAPAASTPRCGSCRSSPRCSHSAASCSPSASGAGARPRPNPSSHRR